MLRMIASAIGAIIFLVFLIRLRIILDNPKDDRFPVMGRCGVCAKRIFIWHRIVPRKVLLLFHAHDTKAVLQGYTTDTMGHTWCNNTMPINASVTHIRKTTQKPQ